MTQQIINVGAVANDGTGESLRSAFQAVNDNFSNVWAQGPVDSQVVISTNVISTNVSNRNLVLQANGIGVITVASSVVPGIDSVWDLGAANAQYDSVYARYYYGDASNMTGLPQPTNLGAVNTDILPVATQAFNIGSQTRQWQKVYTGGIVAGNTSVITINVGNLHIPGGTNGYVLQTDGAGNLSWTAQTGGGSGNGIPGGANTQIQFNDAGAFGGQADFTFNKTSNVMTVPGNIIPNSNAAQSLGNVSHQWKDLWVSNNTIYINSVPLTLSAGNVLSIGGEPLVTVNANSVANIGNFVFNGNKLENTNGSSFDNGGLVNGATALLSLPANGNTGPIAVYNSYGNIVLQAGANADVTAQWNFNNNGTLSTQGNITANSVSLSGQLIFANGSGAVGEVGYGFSGPAINAYTGKSVTIRSNDQAYSWRFGTAGNLTLPDGSVIQSGVIYGNGSAALGNATGDNKVYAQDSGVGVQTNNGNITNTWFYDRNGNLTLPGNTFAVNYANGTPVSIGGDTTLPLANGTSNFNIATANGNATITANATQTWTFDTTGRLVNLQGINLTAGGQFNVCTILTGGGGYGGGGSFSATTGGSGTGLTVGYGYGLSGQVVNASVIDPGDGNYQDGDVITMTAGNGAATFRLTQYNVLANVNNSNFVESSWTFGANGSTIFPTLSVTRGDRTGTLTGFTLNIGDGTNEALLTTPNGVDGSDSQRLVINPGAGSEFGEGGDIYLYSGRGGSSGGSGGDIKIRGGLGPVDGAGGYIDIQGGDTQGNGTGGYVDIRGGESGNAAGGNVNVYGGYGPTVGGIVSITGGQSGSGAGGGVTIAGGIGGNGLPTYGNVNIASGASTWTFDNAGNLTVPNIIQGSADSDYALKLGAFPEETAAGRWLQVRSGDVADHIHFDTSNNSAWNFYVGSDNQYVLIGNTGNITIGSYDSGNNATYQWKFNNTGNLVLPRTGVVYETSIPFGGLEGNTIALKPSGGTNADQQLLVYPTAGADFNHLHLTSGNLYNTELFLGNDNLYVKLANTGDVVINSNDDGGNTAQWTFGTDGNLTFPRNVAGNTDPYLTIVGGADPSISSVDVSLAGPANLNISAQYTIFTGFSGDAIKIYPDDGEIAGDANIQIWTNAASNVSQYSWTFDTVGKLTLPAISTGGEGEQERAQVRGTRKIIGETGTWSTYIDGHSAFGTVAWTASSSTIQSAKITFVVQSNGTAFNWEQFDVSVCKLDGANAFVSVSGRVQQNSAIAYTEVSGYVSDGILEVWLNPADGQTSAYINYNAVEFNIMPD